MANVLKHRFASAKSDGADATQVQPSHWNDGHLFTGGNAGDLLTRDPTDASFGAKWGAPATAGVWTDIPFAASNFVGSGSTVWTVASGNQITFGYGIVGRLATLLVTLVATTVSGTAGTPLRIALPVVPLRGTDALWYGVVFGALTITRARVIANDPVLYLYRTDGTNWALGAGATDISGQVSLHV